VRRGTPRFATKVPQHTKVPPAYDRGSAKCWIALLGNGNPCHIYDYDLVCLELVFLLYKITAKFFLTKGCRQPTRLKNTALESCEKKFNNFCYENPSVILKLFWPISGQCVESYQVDSTRAGDEYECLEACQSEHTCTWFTFFKQVSISSTSTYKFFIQTSFWQLFF